jgi:hypothetical protein
MITKYTILYSNGKTDEVIHEETKEIHDSIVIALNNSYKEGEDAVLRLFEGDKKHFIRLSDTSRITVEVLEED